MADAVATHVVANTQKYYVVHLVNVSDGTGEAAVNKVDISTLVASDGGAPVSLDLAKVRWSVQGFPRVLLYWDHTADDLMLALSGSGYEDFTQIIDDPQFKNFAPVADPRSAGGTGDILLTAPAGATTGSYDITLTFVKRPD